MDLYTARQHATGYGGAWAIVNDDGVIFGTGANIDSAISDALYWLDDAIEKELQYRNEVTGKHGQWQKPGVLLEWLNADASKMRLLPISNALMFRLAGGDDDPDRYMTLEDGSLDVS